MTTLQSSTATTLLSEYQAKEARLSELGSLDCTLANLITQIAAGNTRPWIAESVAELAARGISPTEADHAEVNAERRAVNAELRELGQQVYAALLAEDLAFTIVDHSDRLDTRPFEVTLSALLMGAGTWVSSHGTSLRLARYATRAAAEKTIVKTTAAELARLAS